METPKRLIPVVMMSVTAIAASSLAVQASPPQSLADHPQSQQEVVPVLLATAIPATSTEPEHLIHYRIARRMESGFPVEYGIKWPDSL